MPYDLQSLLILIAKAVACPGVPRVRGPRVGRRRVGAARTVSPNSSNRSRQACRQEVDTGASTTCAATRIKIPNLRTRMWWSPVGSRRFAGDVPSSSAFMAVPANLQPLTIRSPRRCRRVAPLAAGDEARGCNKCGSQNTTVAVRALKVGGVGAGRRKRILDHGGGLVLGEGSPRATCSRSVSRFQNGL